MRFTKAELQNSVEQRAAASEIFSSKTGSRPQSGKKMTILKHFLIGIFKGIHQRQQPCCSHSNTTYDVQLQKTIVLRTHPRLQATLTQQYIKMGFAKAELPNTLELRATVSEIVAPKPDLDAEAKKDDSEALFQRNLERKITSAKIEKFCWQITIAALMQPLQYDLWCTMSSCKRQQYYVLRTQPPCQAPLTKPLQCETSVKFRQLKMWKRSFRARLSSKSERGWKRWMRKRSFRARQCETCLKTLQWKMWKRSFRARPLSKSERGRCENEAFVRDFLQNLKVEDVKTKLSCETSLKKWKWKMWTWSFCARPPSKSESWRCENEAFVWDIPQNLNAEDVKTKLSCETSFKFWNWKLLCHAMSFHSIPSIIPFQSSPYHPNPFQYIPFHSNPIHSIPFQSISFHSNPFHSVPFRSIPFIFGHHTYP